MGEYKTLCESTQLSTSLVVLYTANSGRAALDKVTGANVSGGAVTVDVHIVPLNGAASAANKVVSAKSIAANATDIFPELTGQIMEAGSTLQAKASAATSINFRASGRDKL